MKKDRKKEIGAFNKTRKVKPGVGPITDIRDLVCAAAIRAVNVASDQRYSPTAINICATGNTYRCRIRIY